MMIHCFYSPPFLSLFFAVLIAWTTTCAVRAQSTPVCVSGYPMDILCIDRGRLLDRWDILTLEHPEEHSIHCLVDVPSCVESGYEILVPSSTNTGFYDRAVALDGNGNDLLVKLARSVGFCTTCANEEGAIGSGLAVTVKGDLVGTDRIGDSDGVPPMMLVSSIEEGDMGCSEDSSTVTMMPSLKPTEPITPSAEPSTSQQPSQAPSVAASQLPSGEEGLESMAPTSLPSLTDSMEPSEESVPPKTTIMPPVLEGQALSTDESEPFEQQVQQTATTTSSAFSRRTEDVLLLVLAAVFAMAIVV